MLFDLSATKVTNSRFFRRQNKVWRRRQNVNGVVFTTRESIDFEQLRVKKRSKNSNENYQPGKLFISIHNACDHMQDSEQNAWHLMQTVEEKITVLLDKDMLLLSEQIAGECLTALKRFDTTAYVKYASYQQNLVSARKLAAALN